MQISDKNKDETGRRKSAAVLNYDLFRYRRLASELSRRISAFAVNEKFFDEYEIALCEYFECRDISIDDEDDAAEELFQGEDEIARFLSWYSIYFLTSELKKTFPELYIKAKNRRFSALDREILESFSHSVLAIYEVQSVEMGRGMMLKELFGIESFYVHDPEASKEVCTWDLLFTGLVGAGGFYFLTSFGMIIIPPRLKKIIIDGILSMYSENRKTGRDIRDYLRSRSAEVFAFVQNIMGDYDSFQLRNLEGDPLLFSTMYYRINDCAPFLDAISKSPMFIEDYLEEDDKGLGGRAEYVWIKREGKRRRSRENATRGIILVDGRRLVARCNSLKRADTLKAVLASMFGKTLSYEITVFEELQGPRGPESAEPILNPGLLECREFREMLKEILSRHYEKWADERIPAIGNLSPREAVKTSKGRRRVNDLLKELENRNERALRRGLKCAEVLAFPVETIRKKLGLEH